MKHIFTIFAWVVATLSLLTACDVSQDHVPGEAAGIGVQAYINQDLPTTFVYKPADKQVLSIPVYRAKADRAATVHFNFDDPGHAFSVPSTLAFEAGETVKNLEVPFNIDLGQSYQLTVTIALGEVFTYGAPSQTYKVLRDYEWSDAGTALVKSAWVGNTQPIEVPVQKREGIEETGNAHMYRLYSPYWVMEPDYCPTEGSSIQFSVDDAFNALEVTERQAMGYVDAENGLGNLYIFWRSWGDVEKEFSNQGNKYKIYCPMVCDQFEEGAVYFLDRADGSGIFTETIEFEWNR